MKKIDYKFIDCEATEDANLKRDNLVETVSAIILRALLERKEEFLENEQKSVYS